MKYLKTFENYSINEEEGLFSKSKKFFTGHADDKDREEAKNEFAKNLKQIEELVSKNPKIYVFNKAKLEKLAEDDNYKGKLSKRRSAKDNRIHILYKEGTTMAQKVISGSTGSIFR